MTVESCTNEHYFINEVGYRARRSSKKDICIVKNTYVFCIGQYIATELMVIGTKYQGRKIFQNFTIINANPEAARIGKQQLKALMLASGMVQAQIDQFDDTDQLVGLRCNVRVSVDAGGQYGPQNRVKSFRKLAEVPAPPEPAPVQPIQSPAPLAPQSEAPFEVSGSDNFSDGFTPPEPASGPAPGNNGWF